MSVYRRFIRAKKGMSTIFGGLFFIILILMGFNVMLWGFIQYDSYNSVITTMSQHDQQATAENLVPINPGVTDITGPCPSCSFNITVNNLGIAVSIARIYIVNISPTGSPQCSVSPCTVDPPNLLNNNVPEGVIEWKIKVTGISICGSSDGSGYKVTLASTRGRLFTFFCPWPAPPPPTGQLFQTNIGPLTVFFDFKSFNFTSGDQTESRTAWVTDTNTAMVFWLKVTNAATDSSITLRVHSSLLFFPYSAGGLGAATPFYIVDDDSINPNSIVVYDDTCTPTCDPYVLPAASPSGPGSTTTVLFGAKTQGGTASQSLPQQEQTYLVFIGFYYEYNGNFQGQTVPFVAMRTCEAYPAVSCY